MVATDVLVTPGPSTCEGIAYASFQRATGGRSGMCSHGAPLALAVSVPIPGDGTASSRPDLGIPQRLATTGVCDLVSFARSQGRGRDLQMRRDGLPGGQRSHSDSVAG